MGSAVGLKLSVMLAAAALCCAGPAYAAATIDPPVCPPDCGGSGGNGGPTSPVAPHIVLGGPFNVLTGTSVLLDASGSYSFMGDTNKLVFYWNFGDGTSSAGFANQLSHTFSGTFGQQFFVGVTGIDPLAPLLPGLATTTVTITEPLTSGVPEPATWAIMLMGFAGIGVSMRRRRNVATTQIA